MIFGFTLETFTRIHVFISLVGIASGFVVVGGMLRAQRNSSATSLFLHIVSAIIALYFNCFVATVQAFQKLPTLQPLAPTLSEPPFQIAQGVLLVVMTVLGFLSVRNFHPAPAAA